MITVNSRQDFLLSLKNFIPINCDCVELGVLQGEFSEMILNIIKPDILVLVDPFKIGGGEYLDGLRTAYSTSEDYIKVVERFKQQIKSSQVWIEKMYSYNAAKLFEYGVFDFVYIDADHTYNSVKRDLNDWLPLLKDEGVMCLHDYVELSNFGVIKAVDEFCEEHNFEKIIFNINGGDIALKKKTIMNNFCIITTINKLTKAVEVLYEKFGKNLIIVGDKKTPSDWEYNGIIPIKSESKPYAPDNHYARKNLGYLEAMRRGAKYIYDIDDDTIPNDKWKPRLQLVEANDSSSEGWFNVYKLMCSDYIWPRGFSLRELNNVPSIGNQKFLVSSIQQGMVDSEPDVDAIWRLVMKKEHQFYYDCSVYLKPNTWCPFNSQSTHWFPKAFPLLYLPITATFRMCDIWRSFIAQRILWTIGEGVTFHSPSEVYQDRNEHDLLADFKDEISGYLHNDEIVEILSALTLKQGEEYICENLLTCYDALVKHDILPYKEILSVTNWIRDYEETIAANMARVS